MPVPPRSLGGAAKDRREKQPQHCASPGRGRSAFISERGGWSLGDSGSPSRGVLALHHGAAARTDMGAVPGHAGGDSLDVGHFMAAEPHGVAGAHLLRLRREGEARGYGKRRRREGDGGEKCCSACTMESHRCVPQGCARCWPLFIGGAARGLRCRTRHPSRGSAPVWLLDFSRCSNQKCCVALG